MYSVAVATYLENLGQGACGTKIVLLYTEKVTVFLAYHSPLSFLSLFYYEFLFPTKLILFSTI